MDIERARGLRAEGWSYRKIGEALGAHHTVVFRSLNPQSREKSRAAIKAWTEAHPEKARDYKDKWYQENEEAAKERARLWYKEHPDRARETHAEWRRTHKKEDAAIKARWYEDNREKTIARVHARYQEKRDTILEQNRAYRAAHPELVNEWSAARRARKRDAEVIADRASMVAIYREAKTAPEVTCYLCGGSVPLGQRHVDHVIPLVRGGKHSKENLAITHRKCNLVKSTKLLDVVAV